jgi:hypothetical protein
MHRAKHTTKHERKDIMVAVRLPKNLVDEMKDIQRINHFMDLSDEIRYIVRKHCVKIQGTDTEKELQQKQKLIDELNAMISLLKTKHE